MIDQSHIPIVSKILEKIIAKQLTHYLEGGKLVSNSQPAWFQTSVAR